MINKLPEKLLKLRKHFNYSQQEVANTCDVDLVIYISWENGNKLPPTNELLKLCELYNISVDEIIINDVEIILSENDFEEFPLHKAETEEIIISNIKQNIISEKKVLPIQDTQVINPKELISKQDIKTEQSKPKQFKLDKTQTMMVGGIVVGIVIMILLIASLFPQETTSPHIVQNEIKDNQRLSSAASHTMVLNSNNTINSYGLENNLRIDVDSFVNIAAVATSDEHVAALTIDGHVLASGANSHGQTDVSDWQHIIALAVGKNHTVGLNKDKTVLCTGNEDACAVSTWQNVETIFAAENTTIGITEEGETLISSSLAIDFDKALDNQVISDLTISDSYFAVLYKNGNVYCETLENGDSCKIEEWQDIIQIDSYGDNLAALSSDGKVYVVGDNSYNQTNTAMFTDIIAIAVGDKFVVGLNSNNELIAVGNAEGYPFLVEEAEKLEAVTNINIDINTNVQVNWDEVINASYYVVDIEGVGEYTVAENNLNLPINNFNEGQEYTISIVAASREDNIENADPSIRNFTFHYVTQSTTPSTTTQIIITFNTSSSSSTTLPTQTPTTPTTSTTEESNTEAAVDVTTTTNNERGDEHGG